MKMIWLIGFEESYFKQEQIESLIFIILGILSICLALIFLGIIKYSFFKGMAVPLLASWSYTVNGGNDDLFAFPRRQVSRNSDAHKQAK
jgi:hypothetical protein